MFLNVNTRLQVVVEVAHLVDEAVASEEIAAVVVDSHVDSVAETHADVEVADVAEEIVVVGGHFVEEIEELLEEIGVPLEELQEEAISMEVPLGDLQMATGFLSATKLPTHFSFEFVTNQTFRQTKKYRSNSRVSILDSKN